MVDHKLNRIIKCVCLAKNSMMEYCFAFCLCTPLAHPGASIYSSVLLFISSFAELLRSMVKNLVNCSAHVICVESFVHLFFQVKRKSTFYFYHYWVENIDSSLYNMLLFCKTNTYVIFTISRFLRKNILMNPQKHTFKLRKMILIFKYRNDKFVDLNTLFLFPDKKHYYTKDLFITK